MDTRRFDSLARTVADHRSRRDVLLAIAASVATGPLAVLGTSDDAVARSPGSCRTNGKPCKRHDQCCSGTCKKKQGKGQCKGAPNSFGCTARDDSCSGPDVPCPHQPNSLCLLTSAGRPICVDPGFGFTCLACANDQDCVSQRGNGWACITCADCQQFGTSTACLFQGS